MTVEKNSFTFGENKIDVFMKKIVFSLFILCVLAVGCDKGLSPITEVTGISGTISFENWPPPDSLLDLRIVAFRQFPPQNIVTDILSQQAITYPALGDSTRIPRNIQNFDFQFTLPPDTFRYVVVAQQYGPNILTDWLAAGQYVINPADSLPSTVIIKQGRLLKDVNINVDFHHLPIQPF